MITLVWECILVRLFAFHAESLLFVQFFLLPLFHLSIFQRFAVAIPFTIKIYFDGVAIAGAVAIVSLRIYR